MLTVYDFNRVTFAHHRGIVPPMPAQEGKKAVEKRYVCSANMKLMEYGYIMARDLFDACCKAEYNDFLKTWSALYDCVTEDGKAISQTSPIWPNFPDDAMKADLVDLYVVNFLNYLTCGEWQPDFDPTKFCPALDRSHLPAVKQIPACDEEEIYRYSVQSITGHSPLSPDEVSCVFDTLMHDIDFTSELMDRMKPKHIPCKENLALYVSRIISRPEWREQACFRDFKSSTDVLRLAAAMSDQDVSLSKAPKFRNFKRGERRQLLELLEHTDKNEGFALHPEEFKRLGERLHPGDYSYIFKEDYEIFTKIRNGVKIETYNSKLQELMKKPVNAELLSAHLMMRPGMFARNLDFALRNCSNEQQMENVLFRFISVCKSIEPRVLVQLINHFRNRNNPVHLATGKANGAASKALERDIEPLSENICKRVARDIFNQLWQVLRAEDTEPKSVYIDPDCHCNKLIFPDKDLNQLVVVADCSSALYQDRGTKLGEQNLLSDTAVTFKVYDGTAQVAVMMADILQVPTKQGTMADIWPTPANPLPDKQLAINYLCARNAERQMLCDKDPKDSVAMVLPITTHLYIDSIKVENAYKRRGIATGMLDFAVSLALPETIGLFCANEDAEMKAMLKALKFAQSPLKAQNMPWKEKYFYYKRLKRLAR